MHTVSGRSFFGFSLAMLTMVLWGLLPIALKDVLAVMDPLTITFYRFSSAGVILAIWLAARKGLPNVRQFRKPVSAVLLIAALALSINYGTYLIGLDYLEPKSAQIIIQLAPFLLLIGSVIWFKEPFSKLQSFGVVALLVGLLMFFNQRVGELLGSFGTYTQGVLWIVFAAVMWAIYALLQKQLLRHFTSVQLMMMINLFGGVCFFMLATPDQVLELNQWQLLMLLFCCLNTVIAYGAFAEALAHWEASKVSAVLAATPLVSIGVIDLLAWQWPEYYQSLHLNILALIGAVMVIIGSAVAALGKPKNKT
ncbi:DMT family transporter [Echinimonas agarilytica]|uniref:DMT family transporter n=1 Tax=Echinimonas agarilytica TaxID=1215918 RepID=A0AA41W6B3_9GAMM|nr:DMT family transporter [Echinimonas agarilytica]MCM2679458.1 DMT family transporter [Echinimonas agarilytica]